MTTAPAEKTVFDVFAFDQEALANQVEIFQRLRDQAGPVVHMPELGMYFVLDYENIVAVVREPKLFSSEISAGESTNQIYEALVERVRASGEFAHLPDYGTTSRLVLAFADPPQHTRHRAPIGKAFSPAKVRELEPSIRAIADRLIDSFIDRGQVEMFSQFAAALSIRLIATALRCPEDDVPMLKRWSDDFLAAIASPIKLGDQEVDHFAQSRLDFDRYFGSKIEDEREHAHDDLFSAIVHGSAAGEQPLSNDEILMMLQEFLVGGTETAALATTSIFAHLITDPSLVERLRNQPDLIPSFVEESLRCDAPAQLGFRAATEDTELGGVPIPAGSTVVLHWACASRDPKVFQRPDDFEVTRDSRRHMAFGQGIHTCVGSGLARAEIRIGVERILARLDNLQLTKTEPTSWVASVLMHGRNSLPVTFTPRT